MNEDAEFRGLFQFLIEQYRLRPETAQKLLQRILQILSEAAESEETDK